MLTNKYISDRLKQRLENAVASEINVPFDEHSCTQYQCSMAAASNFKFSEHHKQQYPAYSDFTYHPGNSQRQQQSYKNVKYPGGFKLVSPIRNSTKEHNTHFNEHLDQLDAPIVSLKTGSDDNKYNINEGYGHHSNDEDGSKIEDKVDTVINNIAFPADPRFPSSFPKFPTFPPIPEFPELRPY